MILDAWYRFLPQGISEGLNSDVTSLYNRIDGYANHLNAAWVNVHHTSKGDQTDKGTTDVGSGAGSQSRAADAHLVLRPHEEDGVAVLEGVVRSFPPFDPIAIRFDFPGWFRDRLVDTRKLRRPGFEKQAANDAEGQTRILEALEAHGHGTARKLRDWTGMGQSRLQRLLHDLVTSDRVIFKKITTKGNACEDYSLPPQK